jgi:sugar lactone lactonase YvrE
MRYHLRVISRLFCIVALASLAAGATGSDPAREEIAQLEKALPQADDPAAFMHVIAVNYALLGEKAPALAWLDKLSLLRPDFDPSGDRHLAVLAPEPRFRRLVENVHTRYPPVVHSKVAFRIVESDLVPEGIAFDPTQKAFYLGSIHKRKIVKVSRNGAVRDFVSSGQDGLHQVLGMKVHPQSRTLWVLSNSDTTSGVFRFDLRTGKLIRKFLITGRPKEHLFNDLVVTRSQGVFLTDTNAGKLYWISHHKSTLEEFHRGLAFPYANGIAISPDEKKLFVAHFNGGISAVDIASRQVRVLPRQATASTAGIDGLYFYRESLIAVQNAFGNTRIVRYFLTHALDGITHVETLEYRNPLFGVPTTAAIAGDSLYYMANTCLDRYENGNFTPGTPLSPLLILKRRLSTR